MCRRMTLSMGSLQLHDSHTRIPCNRVNVHRSVVAACANQVWQIQLRRGLHRKAGSPCLTGAFELGHRPVSAPSSRRHHAIGQSPFSAPPGRCRSTLSLGPTGAPTHRVIQRCDVSVNVARFMVLLVQGGTIEGKQPALLSLIYRKQCIPGELHGLTR
jgi:hypothetical protein